MSAAPHSPTHSRIAVSVIGIHGPTCVSVAVSIGGILSPTYKCMLHCERRGHSQPHAHECSWPYSPKLQIYSRTHKTIPSFPVGKSSLDVPDWSCDIKSTCLALSTRTSSSLPDIKVDILQLTRHRDSLWAFNIPSFFPSMQLVTILSPSVGCLSIFLKNNYPFLLVLNCILDRAGDRWDGLL